MNVSATMLFMVYRNIEFLNGLLVHRAYKIVLVSGYLLYNCSKIRFGDFRDLT